MQKEESHLENKPDELLKVYIKLLKDQIEDLKMQIEMEEMNPRYMILRNFFTPGFPLLEIDMQDWLDEEESMLANYQTNVESLKNYRPPVLPKMLRELISEFRLQKSRETFW